MFYGWRIVATIQIAQLLAMGFGAYGYAVIVVPVKEEFSATATEVNMIMTFASAISLVAPPLIGTLVDRWSARGLMIIGSGLLISGLVLLSMTQSILQFALVFGLFVMSSELMLGPIAGSAIIVRWFTASQGRALGIVSTGVSVGGIVLPPLIAAMLLGWGWRAALQVLAAVAIVVVFPAVLIVIRNYPADLGLEAESHGDSSALESEESGNSQVGSTSEILKSRSLWLLGCSSGLMMTGFMAVLSNLGLYVAGQGFEVTRATPLISAIAFSGLIGKLVFGAVMDRIGPRACIFGAQALTATGILLLSFEPSYGWMLVAAVTMGLATGGMMAPLAALTAMCFGNASFGRAMGLITPIMGLLTMPGFTIAGLSADWTGSFSLAMRGFVVLIAISAIMISALRLPSRHGTPRQASG